MSQNGLDSATQYALDVTSGRIVAGPHVRDACARHLDDLERGHERGLTWDRQAAERMTGFCRDVCRLAGGQFEGQPFNPLPWQQFILQSLFGWKKENGKRRFRRCYIETAKGTGKSPLAASIGLYMLAADGESRAEVYAAATKKDQAMVLFRDAVAMVQQSANLRKRIVESGRNPVWQLTHTDSRSFFRPISADDGQSGPRPSCALVDELHEHRDGDVLMMLERGFKWREQPLLFMITNSGFDRETVCFEEHLHACRVAAREIEDDKTFSYVCGLDPGDDPLADDTCWIKANPSLGAIVPVDHYREEVRTAKQQIGKRNNILRLQFCVWTDAESAWIGGDAWRACETDEIERGEFCYGGLDLSSKNDLTALSLVWPHGDGTICSAETWFWTPGDTMKARSDRDHVDYALWVEQGHLIAPPGSMIDYAFVAQKIAELAEPHKIKVIAFDPHKIDYLRAELDDIGCAVELLPHSQGFWRTKEAGLWMPESVVKLEQRIYDRTIRVKSNPVMRWCASNAVTRSDEHENRKFDKRKSTGRIDGVVSLAMAIGVAYRTDGGASDSVWERLAAMNEAERKAYL